MLSGWRSLIMRNIKIHKLILKVKFLIFKDKDNEKLANAE